MGADSHSQLSGTAVHQEISGHLEAQPAGCHAGGDLEQIRHDSLVEALDALLFNDARKGVHHRCVLQSHALHRVDLETPAQNVTVIDTVSTSRTANRNACTLPAPFRQALPPPLKMEQNSQWVCTRLSHGTRDGTRRQLAHRTRVLISIRSQILAHLLVHHEVEAHVRRDTGHRGDNAPVQRHKPTLGLVHVAHGGPHARQLVAAALFEILEAGAVNRQARAHNVERVCEGDGGDAGKATTGQAHCCRQIGPGGRLEKVAFVKVVAAELDGRIGHDPDAVGAIAAHEAAPALLDPHLLQRLTDGQLVLVAASGLDLEQDLEAFEGRHDGARDGARDAAGAEGGNDGLGDKVLKMIEGFYRRDRAAGVGQASGQAAGGL